MNILRDRLFIVSAAITVAFYLFIAILVFFLAKDGAFESAKASIEYLKNSFDFPSVVLFTALMVTSFITMLANVYIIVKTQDSYRRATTFPRERPLWYTGFYGWITRFADKKARTIFNCLAIVGIVLFIISETFLFGVICLAVITVLMQLSNNTVVLFSIGAFFVVVTYYPIHALARIVFNKLFISRKCDYLTENDVLKIKGWGGIITAVYTFGTVIVSIISIINPALLAEMNIKNDLSTSLFIMGIGLLTYSLRQNKGHLRVI